MSIVRHSVTYEDAETRGRVRAWKKQLADAYLAYDRAMKSLTDNGKPGPLVRDMVMCTRTGRLRAFQKINKALGPGVTLEGFNSGKNNRSLAIWSIMMPRSSVTVGVHDNVRMSKKEWKSLTQDCVTINYILIGCIDDVVQIAEGLWTLEVPDHALGRAVERTGFQHPGQIIREAHEALLELPMALLEQQNFLDRNTPGVYLKAGPGCFAGHLHVSQDITGNNSASFRVKTWLSEDQLFDRQVILSEKAEPGKRLGDSVLLPSPLCRIEQTEDDKIRMRIWRGYA